MSQGGLHDGHEEPGPDVNVPPDRSDIWDEHVRPHFSNEYEFGAIYHHLMSCLFPPHLVEIEWICALSLCRRWCYTGLELIWCNAPDSRVISTSFCRDRIKEAFVVPSAFLKKNWGSGHLTPDVEVKRWTEFALKSYYSSSHGLR